MAAKRFSGSSFSTKFLTEQGYVVANVEQTIRYPKKGGKMHPVTRKPLEWEMFKRDLFNIADLLAVNRKHPGVLFVQHTTQEKVNNRITKIAGLPVSRTLVAAGNRIHVHGWKARGGKGGKPKTWELSITTITFDDEGMMVTARLQGTEIGDQEGLAFEESEVEEKDDATWLGDVK